jgi:hypothetical protein
MKGGNSMADETKRESRSDIDNSTVAQLIEVGLVARYRNDPDGVDRARREIRAELLAKKWVLPPHTYDDDMR